MNRWLQPQGDVKCIYWSLIWCCRSSMDVAAGWNVFPPMEETLSWQRSTSGKQVSIRRSTWMDSQQSTVDSLLNLFVENQLENKRLFRFCFPSRWQEVLHFLTFSVNLVGINKMCGASILCLLQLIVVKQELLRRPSRRCYIMWEYVRPW